MKKKFSILCIVLLIFTFIMPVNAFADNEDNSPIAVERYSGTDRYDTAIQIADQLADVLRNNGQFENIVLASGVNWPDAIAGTPLAVKLKAPILLLDRTPELSSRTFDYIKQHLSTANNIYILGGTGVIPDSYINYLIDMGYPSSNIHRIGGIDRNETSLLISQSLYNPQNPDSTSNPDKALILVSDENFSDSLNIATYSGKYNIPILLISKNGLTDKQKEYADQFSNMLYVGDIGKWINDVYPRKNSMPFKPYLVGNNPYETNAVVESLHKWDSQIFIAQGEDYPDALAGAVLAAAFRSGFIVLTKPNEVVQETAVTLNDLAFHEHSPLRPEAHPPIFYPRILVLGGQGAVSDNVVDQAKSILLSDGAPSSYDIFK